MSGLLQPQRGHLPHAEPNPVSAPFWEGATAGRLRYQACATCGAPNVPPVELCRDCQGTELNWHDSAGTGSLYSWTVVHRPVTLAFAVPYAPAIVTLDEGFQLVTNLIGVAPEHIVAGMPVRVEFHQVDAGLRLPYFRPARPDPSLLSN